MFLPKSYSWTTQYLPQTPCGWSKELWPLILQWSLQTWCPKQAKQIARLKPLCRNSSDCRYEMAASMGQIWVPKLWDGWCVLKTANPSAKHWFIAQWHDTQPWPGFKTVAIEPGQVEPQFGWSFCRIKLGHLEPNRFEQSGAVLKWGRPQIIHAIFKIFHYNPSSKLGVPQHPSADTISSGTLRISLELPRSSESISSRPQSPVEPHHLLILGMVMDDHLKPTNGGFHSHGGTPKWLVYDGTFH